LTWPARQGRIEVVVVVDLRTAAKGEVGGKRTRMQAGPRWMTGGEDLLQRPGEMTGIVTEGGTMEGIVMTGIEVAETVEEVSPVMNLLGIEMVEDTEDSPGMEAEMDTPEIVDVRGKLLRKDLSWLLLPDQPSLKMSLMVELLSPASLEEQSLWTLLRKRRR